MGQKRETAQKTGQMGVPGYIVIFPGQIHKNRDRWSPYGSGSLVGQQLK